MVMRITPEGVALIKRFEGLHLTSYLCPAKVWTIGYGHTRTAVKGMRITEAQAEALLREDLKTFELAVNVLVEVPITPHQFSALVSLAFNIGHVAFKRSTLLAKLNAVQPCADEFMRWNRAGGRALAGLISRRAEERALFLRSA